MKLLGIAISLNKLVLTFLCSMAAEPTATISPCVCMCESVCASLYALPQQLDYRTVEKLFINVTPPGVCVAFSSFILVFTGFGSAQCDFRYSRRQQWAALK